MFFVGRTVTVRMLPMVKTVNLSNDTILNLVLLSLDARGETSCRCAAALMHKSHLKLPD